MNKILISGYYGFGNQGDEAILESIINDIRERYNNVEITVLTANWKYTKKNFDVNVINRNKYLSTIFGIAKTDVLISGGGSLLQDVTSPRSLYYYLAILVLGIIFNKKILLLSHGIGPINNKFNKLLTRFILNKVDFISVREEHSKEDLIDMGVKKEINVSVDPVIDLKKVNKDFGSIILKGKIDSDKKTIGMCLRSDGFQNGKNYEELKGFIENMNKSYNLVFLPFHHGQDFQILEMIENDFNNDVVILDNKFTVDEILSIVENFDLLIGERLHSLIFSVVANTPIIGISYDPKIEYFLNSLEFEPIFKIEEFNKEKLIGEVNRVFENYSSIKEKLINNFINLKGRFKMNLEALDRIIN